MTTATDLPPAHDLEGPCVLAQCRERPTGYVAGAEPPMLVCPAHTGPVERSAEDYHVRSIPTKAERLAQAPELSREG